MDPRKLEVSAEKTPSMGFKQVGELIHELGAAYRALQAFYSAQCRGETLDGTAVAYHALTIGAAIRYVDEQKLDGGSYFEGRPPEVLREVLQRRMPGVTA